MNENFKTQIEVEIDYDSVKPKGYDFENRTSDGLVSWNLSLELNTRGVKNFYVSVPDQEITFNLDLQPDNEDETISTNFVVKLSNIEVEETSAFRVNSSFGPNILNVSLTSIQQISKYEFRATAVGKLEF